MANSHKNVAQADAHAPAVHVSTHAAGGSDPITGAIAPTTIELGHASDTTISRVSAGVIAVEGVTINTKTIANDTIWDAAGDLVQGTGADASAKLSAGTAGKFLTAAGAAAAVAWGQGPLTTTGDLLLGATGGTPTRLAIGAAGGALSVINSAVAWNSGTSFPGSKATGDRYWRTDLQGVWFWDGTQWLSEVPHEMAFPLAAAPPLASTGVLHRMIMPAALGGSDVYLAVVLTSFYVAGGTALGASHNWVGTVSKANTAGASSLGTITINSGASDQWRAGTTLTINAAAGAGSGYVALEINWVKTGTPGSLYANCSMAYRSIAT